MATFSYQMKKKGKKKKKVTEEITSKPSSAQKEAERTKQFQETGKVEPRETAPVEKQPDAMQLGKKKEVIDLTAKKPDTSITGQIKKSLSYSLGDPRSLKTTAALGIALTIILTAGGATATAKAAQVGTQAIVKSPSGAIVLGGAGKFATNTKTIAQTQSWLSKIFTTTKTVTSTNLATGVQTASQVTTVSGLKTVAIGAAAGLIVGAIGSYPFAGFIKEEALQTLSLGVRAAIENDDIEGAQKALAEQDEVLDPSVWDKILESIPYANVLKTLKDFYNAAKTKNAIDKQVVENMIIQRETGDTEAEKWANIETEREEKKEKEKEEDEDYYEAIREENAKAKAEERKVDEAYWNRIIKKNEEARKKQREEESAYWEAVRKAEAERKLESMKSNLNFGLLG